MGKGFLRICVSSAGKPYIRSVCRPSDEQVETFVNNPIVKRNQECMKRYAHNPSLLKKCLKGEIDPFVSQNLSDIERKEKLKHGFFGPDGKYYPY